MGYKNRYIGVVLCEMQALNLPPYPFKIKLESGKHKIFDPVRRKYLILTPEEWVRQHFIQFLILRKGFPGGLFKIEGGVSHHQRQGRYDVMVANRAGKPIMLIECKAPSVKLDEETLFQIARYNTEMEVSYFCITNGLKHVFLEIDHEIKQIKQLPDLPDYNYLTQ